MADALIGYTGFVGSMLNRSHSFDERFNSTNFEDIAGKNFDLVVCAGVVAEKWVANQDPEGDWNRIRALRDVLNTISAREFILISTIDVYPHPARGGNEATAIDPAENHAYGRNRFRFEQWCVTRFPGARIVRLPALFGPGLKKNALYDLLHDNLVEKIDPGASYQWYPLARLWGDLALVRQHELPVANLFAEPLSMQRILDRCFPRAKVAAMSGSPASYRVGTRYAEAFGGAGEFIMTAQVCLELVAAYVASARA